MKQATFLKGINIGGWLAQYFDCKTDLPTHFATNFTRADLERIASWGADHVRLPFEWTILEDGSLQYMKDCVQWCKELHLGILLDLHYVQGQTFGDQDTSINPLFRPDGEALFLRVWDFIARNFVGTEDFVAFELINEVQDHTGYLWNKLAAKGVATIRKHCPNNDIYIGSNWMNSHLKLDTLHILDDPHIVYNFHYYDPHPFTHQLATFDQDMLDYNRAIPYPSEFTNLKAFMDDHIHYTKRNGYLLWQRNDKALIQENMKYAAEFIRFTGQRLYCGEFGVIEQADQQDAADWVHDVVEELRRIGVGYAYWNYRERDFGIVGSDGEVRFPKLIPVLFGKSK